MNNCLCGQEFTVLDSQGFIQVVDLMGDDTSLVQAARISYGKGTKSLQSDESLIRFLIRHDHGTPTEMVVLKVHVKAPLFVVRQWMRHRMSSFNEYSGRYSVMPDEFYVPTYEVFQKQSAKNKQSRDQTFTQEEYEELVSKIRAAHHNSYATYLELLEAGVAREIARGVLPLDVMTRFYWQVNGRSLMNFLKLRCHQSGQHEIREYGLTLLKIFKEWMPITSKAFEDYILRSRSFAAPELKLLKDFVDVPQLSAKLSQVEQLSQREKEEFIKNLSD